MLTLLTGIVLGLFGQRYGAPLIRLYLRKETQLKKEIETL